MIIKKVESKEEASACDILLTKLIKDEKKYNDNIDEPLAVIFYPMIYNKKNNYLFIAKEDKIVGYIYIKIIEGKEELEKADKAVIDALYVEENFRGKGIATSLIKEAINFLQEKEINYITISVISKNEIAKKLYQKIGFKEYSISLKYDLN